MVIGQGEHHFSSYFSIKNNVTVFNYVAAATGKWTFWIFYKWLTSVESNGVDTKKLCKLMQRTDPNLYFGMFSRCLREGKCGNLKA